MNNKLRNAVRLYEMGRFRNAVQELIQIGDEEENSILPAYYLGLCYTKLDDYENALPFLEQVVTTSENILHIYQCRMILGYIYTLMGRYKLAQFEFDELLNAGYESPQNYCSLGYIAYMQKNLLQSIDYFDKALLLDPSNPNALNSLGYTLAELGKNLDRAEELCKKALRKRPQYPAYLDSLGWVYYKQGKLELSKEHIRRALNKAGKNSEIAEHLRIVMGTKKKD